MVQHGAPFVENILASCCNHKTDLLSNIPPSFQMWWGNYEVHSKCFDCILKNRNHGIDHYKIFELLPCFPVYKSILCISRRYFLTLKVEILLMYSVKNAFRILIILLHQSFLQRIWDTSERITLNLQNAMLYLKDKVILTNAIRLRWCLGAFYANKKKRKQKWDRHKECECLCTWCLDELHICHISISLEFQSLRYM